MVSYNPNLLAFNGSLGSAPPVAVMGQAPVNAPPQGEAEMEQRRKRRCKYGRKANGRCRKA